MSKGNEVANMGATLINAAMNSDASNQNRQAKLTLFMYENEVTYSAEQLERLFKPAGEVTAKEVQAKAVAAVSDDYADAIDQVLSLREAKKKAGKLFPTADEMLLAALTSKINAANMLFIRAATATIYLRRNKATRVTVQPNGAMRWFQPIVDDKGKADPEGGVERITLSNNALVREGQKIVDTIKPRKVTKTKADGAPNPARSGVAPQADLIVNRVRHERSQPNAAGYDGMKDDERKSLDSLLHELMAAKFLDDKGRIDKATVIEYLEAEFPAKPATKPATKQAA